MEKFGGKYRSESHRMPKWNYGGNGIYFITIVVQDHICHLGRIKNKKMILSEFGKIAEQEWHRSFELRNELFFDEFVIMPNHIHALIGIKKPTTNESDDNPVDTHGRAYQKNDDSDHPDSHDRANQRAPDPRAEGRSGERKFFRKPKSVSSFIAGFKSVVISKIDDYIDEHHLNIRKFNRRNKFWQDNYHDRIIKTDTQYWNVKRYIVRNPEDWNEDDYFKT